MNVRLVFRPRAASILFLLLVDITLVRHLSILLSHFQPPEFSFPLFFFRCLNASSPPGRLILFWCFLFTCGLSTFWERRLLIAVLSVFPTPPNSCSLSFLSQAKRSQAVCPDPSVPVNALAWRPWCGAVTSTFTRCPKASPET